MYYATNLYLLDENGDIEYNPITSKGWVLDSDGILDTYCINNEFEMKNIKEFAKYIKEYGYVGKYNNVIINSEEFETIEEIVNYYNKNLSRQNVITTATENSDLDDVKDESIER